MTLLAWAMVGLLAGGAARRAIGRTLAVDVIIVGVPGDDPLLASQSVER